MSTVRTGWMDEWADHLDVDNDADAVIAVRRLAARAQELEKELRDLARSVPDHDEIWGTDLAAEAAEASWATRIIADGLHQVEAAFLRHERGEH
ncbi:hypothetical protein ACIA03_28090 [Nocardioides sp. NPDC051685]|uniref:hypothetical protein n=1 Tax=Nocardioides sp. NPDC051685 TaxID=3364334 RepID=UPI00379FCF09